MAYDLIIKNGTVVDGTGLPSCRTDVGVKDGRVVARGNLGKDAAKVIDAEGKIVAPGFVDIHTHYDAQILWDPLMTCSPWHGATTVVMGNCGFTLAPCRPQDRDFVARMFARVEGMNLRALEIGVDWKWQSFGEYLDRISGIPLGINAATMVGHSALRRYVMGEDAGKREANADEVQEMKALVREAMQVGAFGFTTSLSPTHYDWDGSPVPSRKASHAEVIELSSALSEFHVGGLEIISETAVRGPDAFSQSDQDLLIKMSLVSGRPVNFNELSHSWDRPTVWKQQIAFMERAQRLGAQVYGVTRYQRLDSMFNLSSPSSFDKYPKWLEVLSLPREKAIAAMRNGATRTALVAEMEKTNGSEIPSRQLPNVAFVKSKTGKHAQHQGKRLGELGAALGKKPVELLLDWSADENLEAEFSFIGTRNGDMASVAKIITSPFAIAGISDAGAHTDRLSGSYYSTFLLSHWVRDEKLMTLEEAIRRLTAIPAALYSLHDRGQIREGLPADIVIFDLEKLAWLPTERLNDFPGGESRLANRAEGYDALIVGGKVVMDHGRDTGARPGKV
ncbi:MAG: D-aminoacylase, partial [Dehalococcoidia bacterium]|nr:D-aminoacylase [Dehalococcoidia bacterium]